MLTKLLSGLYPKPKESVCSLDSALQTLGITEDERDEILSIRTMTRLERATAIAEEGDSSFKSFVSYIIAEYEKFRSIKTSSKTLDRKTLLRMIRRAAAEGIDGREGFMITLIYLYRKLGALAKDGDSDWDEVQ